MKHRRNRFWFCRFILTIFLFSSSVKFCNSFSAISSLFGGVICKPLRQPHKATLLGALGHFKSSLEDYFMFVQYDFSTLTSKYQGRWKLSPSGRSLFSLRYSIYRVHLEWNTYRTVIIPSHIILNMSFNWSDACTGWGTYPTTSRLHSNKRWNGSP